MAGHVACLSSMTQGKVKVLLCILVKWLFVSFFVALSVCLLSSLIID